MLVMGCGAEDSMERMTTSTSGRPDGESRAKWMRTRRLWPSNTVTGRRLPGEEEQEEERDGEEERMRVARHLQRTLLDKTQGG